MDCVTVRVLNRCNLWVDIIIPDPKVFVGNCNVLRKTTITVHSDNLNFFADMTPTGAAETADSTSKVGFYRDKITFFYSLNTFAEFNHITAELMAEDQRWFDAILCPLIPRIDVDIGSANSAHPYLNQYFSCLRFGYGGFDKLKPCRSRLLRYRFHRLRHVATPPK
jgi:hypothetical protein